MASALVGAVSGTAGFPKSLIDQLQEVNDIDLESLGERLANWTDPLLLPNEGVKVAPVIGVVGLPVVDLVAHSFVSPVRRPCQWNKSHGGTWRASL